MSDDDESHGLSVKAMTIGVMVLVAYICWALAANSYMGVMFDAEDIASSPRRGRGLAWIIGTLISFLLNSVRIDHAPGIIKHAFTEKQWIIVLFGMLMGCTVLFGMWVKKLETELAGPKRKKSKRKKKRKRRPIE